MESKDTIGNLLKGSLDQLGLLDNLVDTLKKTATPDQLEQFEKQMKDAKVDLNAIKSEVSSVVSNLMDAQSKL